MNIRRYNIANYGEGYRLGQQMTGLGALMGVGIATAHERGMQAMQNARETNNYYLYEQAVQTLVNDARELANLATQLSAELAAERQKNESLTNALVQRQAIIDAFRNM